MYGPHLRVLFHYITDPVVDKEQFTKISDFQNFLSGSFKTKLIGLYNASLKSLDLPAKNHHFTFDRRIFTGHDEESGKRFFDPKEVKREYIKPYTGYIISGLARTIGTIDYLNSYDMDDLPNIMTKNLRKSAINNVVGRFKLKDYVGGKRGADVRNLPNIVSRKELFETVREFKKFLTPRFNQKQTTALLNSSYEMFKMASEQDLKGYVCTIKYVHMMMNGDEIERPYNCNWDFMEAENFMEEEYFVVGGKNFLVDPNQLLINHRQKFHELRDRYRLYHPERADGIVNITSDVTGRTVRVNVKGAFSYQEDLKNFLPIMFSESLEFGEVKIDKGVGGRNDIGQWAWNYDYGRPTSWKNQYATFGGLFPDAKSTEREMYDLMYTVRLTQSLRPFSNMFTTVP